MAKKILLGITQGDINGISYEVIIKSFLDNRMLDFCSPVVYGSPKVAAYHRKALNINNFSFHNINSIKDFNPKRVNIIDCLGDEVRVELGKSTKQAGQASLKALEEAVGDMLDRKFFALVTGPIDKDNIQSDKFRYHGHTDYLKDKFNVEDVLMLLIYNNLRVGVVSGHVALKDIYTHITKENILSKLNILNKSLTVDFAIRKPKIAVLGLNPHAGDNGLLGNEENEIILPAIETARNNNIMALGPYPADGFFGSRDYEKFDAVLAMYHDQGLTPFKTLAFDKGVNYTAGLPIIRTSPVHGTALSIAGKNQANEESFREAVYLACDIYKNKIMNKELNKNPLPHYNIETNGENGDNQ